jgi:hypothetical protein
MIRSSIIDKDSAMKRFLIVTLLTFATASAYAAEVGISIAVGEPGFYGQIDIGDYPPPRLIYAEPVIVQPVIVEQVVVVAQPVYLRVQPEHVQHWDQYCGQYGACGQRVYFVQDSWYDEVYVPAYQERHGNSGNKGNKGKNSKNKGKNHRK